MTIPGYLAAVGKQYRTGIAREHAYRGDLQALLGELCSGLTVTNEPAGVACGAPDYILTRRQVPVGYVEAKDIGVDLDGKSVKEQFDRYRGALDNLIITDYLEFRFFRYGAPTATVRIAEVFNDKINAMPENFDTFTALVADFAAWHGQTIGSPKTLATMMAGKARLLADVIGKAVGSDEDTQANTHLREQMEGFRRILIHDITPTSFADLYSQTIAYGMFAARLHDPTPATFSRVEAATLIPKSNPFLRKLFQTISGYDLDERIVWIVDALADIFRAVDIATLLAGFGKDSGREDAFMHFYEDFLAQYDPKLRKSRGVWYTPDAVVRFIVRAVDDILQSDFGLPTGLADSSVVRIRRTEHTKATADRRSKAKDREIEEDVHRVQVLDPATGTGTFLAEVVRQVHGKFQGQEGAWGNYVEQHLIPRLNGFELLMASYAMAHLKLDLVLRDTGYDMGQSAVGAETAERGAKEQQRLRVFLTNSLEEAHPEAGTLFASWLSDEANQASAVKRDTPVMVVLGNPPYSGISTNKGKWISDLIEDYKYVDGVHFGERKHWLQDDYVKFIRFGEHFIEKTGEGILAYINNHSFLDNPTFRGMRWHLLNTFDKIYVIDLHGNKKKKEVGPDGLRDDNVFDIQQGVSINLFVRSAKRKKGQLAKVYHADLWGARDGKYATLKEGSLKQLQLTSVKYTEPFFFFQPKDESARNSYDESFSLSDLFPQNVTGIVTARDSFVTDFEKATLVSRMEDFANLSNSDQDARLKYFGSGTKGKYEKGDSRGWKLPAARRTIGVLEHSAMVRPYAYRPFDERVIYYHPAMIDWGRDRFMAKMMAKDNLGIVLGRQGSVVGQMEWNLVFAFRRMTDFNMFYRGGVLNLPLYLFPEGTSQTSMVDMGIEPNLDPTLVAQLAARIGLAYRFDPSAPWSHGVNNALTPLDVLDYCYGVLYSPAYRSKYKEFLKSAFPRIPFPTDASRFRSTVRIGARLRNLHLLEDPAVEQFITTFPAPGNNEVTRRMSANSPGWVSTGAGVGKVWINDQQFFADVPEAAWMFYVGGYQPAQKWLKDRNGRALTFDEIRHYQRMIVALTETGRLMEEVDTVGVV